MHYEFALMLALLAIAIVLFSYPQVKMFWRLTRNKDAYVKTDPSSGSTIPVTKNKVVKDTSPLPRGRSQLRAPTFVDFDPTNLVHQAALHMMMAEQRLHPVLRFHFDSSRFDNAFDACVSAMAEYAIPDEAKTLAKVTAALKKADANPKPPAKKSPRKRSTSTSLAKKINTVNKKVGRSSRTSDAKVPSLKLC